MRRPWSMFVPTLTLFIILLSSSLNAQQIRVGSDSIRVNENFKATLIFSNVYCWIDGSCRGTMDGKYGNMARTFDRMLSSAQHSADFSIYGIQGQEWLFKGMNAAVNRSVKVRAVVDQKGGRLGDWQGEHFTYPHTAFLPKYIGSHAVLPDLNINGSVRASTIMHNKFVVLDKRYVWTGSSNFSATEIGAEYNANVTLLVDSPAFATLFSQEFQQMFEHRRFSTAKLTRSKRLPLIYNDQTRVAVFFSPQDSPIDTAILPFIRATHYTLDIGMFFLTEPRIAEEIVRAMQRGVKVRLIMDALGARNTYSQHRALHKAGAEVRVENWGGKMHMKAAISDKNRLLIGSMNWSRAGNQKNDENIVMIDSNRHLATEFMKHFELMWARIPALRPGQFEPRAESRESINSCYDGIDNDHNGMIDETDQKCS